MAKALSVAALGLCAWMGTGPASAGPARRPAVLALMYGARDGRPEPPLRVAQHALPHPTYQARLKKLGFAHGVAVFSPKLTLDYLKQFNVVIYLGVDSFAGPGGVPPQFVDMAAKQHDLLLEYVRQGGGLLVLRNINYAFRRDIDQMNRWLKPCDIEILPEQVVDEESSHRTRGMRIPLYWTDAFAEHRVTRGVRGLFYPDSFSAYTRYSDFSSPLRVGPDWQVVVRGRKTAKSLAFNRDTKTPVAKPGTYAAGPPVMAVRDYGKGRLAVLPIPATCLWQDGYHFIWGGGLLMHGQAAGMRGDAARLLDNTLVWLAEPSLARFGGYKTRAYTQPKEAGLTPINWDQIGRESLAPGIPHCYVGLIGARSSLSVGQGTPEAFIQAAKAAGYQFIAFAEDLRRLTPDKFDRLRAVCRKASDDTFRAYAGFTYLDESGNTWITFSNRLTWPKEDSWSKTRQGHLTVNNVIYRGYNMPPIVQVASHRNPEKPWYQGNYYYNARVARLPCILVR